MNSMNENSVASFYAGKSIFITSGTGFIGKVFLEKILYSCVDIDRVYVLVREKNDKTVDQRLAEVFDTEMFYRIKNERPDALSKVVPLSGDICDENLGIRTKDEGFIDKVSVVFHVAASIKFNERLDLSLQSNVEGTRKVLNLCRRMRHLKAFVHLSTAYTNTDEKILEEKVYPPATKLQDVYKFIEKHGVEDVKKIKLILNGRPNTYTFNKALAENLIADEKLDVPAIIIRPSIVSPAYKEPLEGWVDTWMGASGLIVSTAKGLNRVIFTKKDNVLDLIPVDFVVNFMIVVAARSDRCQQLAVYNCCSSGSNPITYQDILYYMNDFSKKTGFNDAPYPTMLYTTNESVDYTSTFMLQRLPAYFADYWRRILGKKPRYTKMQSQVISSRQLLKFFTARSWVMKSDGVRSVYQSLNPQDRQTFPCDPGLINWHQYIPIYLRGIKRYLLKV